jgi:hypothetical protein
MSQWRKVDDGCCEYEEDTWFLSLRHDEAGAMLEVYNGTSHVTTVNWGPAANMTTGNSDWYMRQSLKVLESEKKKRN